MKFADLGRLLRASLAPSAAADAVAGLVFASGGRFPIEPRAWWLVGSSLCVYHGALALNDWNDRDHDARTRPDRPLPSRAVSPGVALALGLALVAAGVALAALLSWTAATWMAAVAAAALAYDFAGRGPWVGPLLLAVCRAGNLSCALFVLPRLVGREPDLVAFVPGVAYGAYVFLVSRLGRMEDAEDAAPLGDRPSRLLRGVAAVPVLMVLVSLALFFPREPGAGDATLGAVATAHAAALALALAGTRELWNTAARTRAWTRGLVERAMGMCLRRLLIVTACVALLRAGLDRSDAWIAAALILAGYPIAHALRRVFPPS